MGTSIKYFAPSVVPLTPETDAGLFLAVVLMIFVFYLIFKFALFVARVIVATLRNLLCCCCCCQKGHVKQEKGNGISRKVLGQSHVIMAPVEQSSRNFASRTRASTPPPSVKLAAQALCIDTKLPIRE